MDGKMIAERVFYYHLGDLKCVTTILKILAEKYNLPLAGQVDRVQCGLYRATLGGEKQMMWGTAR